MMEFITGLAVAFGTCLFIYNMHNIRKMRNRLKSRSSFESVSELDSIEAEMPLHAASQELTEIRGNGKVHADVVRIERPTR